jgi:hypothetical protein
MEQKPDGSINFPWQSLSEEYNYESLTINQLAGSSNGKIMMNHQLNESSNGKT